MSRLQINVAINVESYHLANISERIAINDEAYLLEKKSEKERN